MKIWNIGIAGTGMISEFHAQAIVSLPNTRLAGFTNVRPEKSRLLALKYGVTHWDSYTEMIQSDKIDIVMVATPSGAHEQPVIEAAKYGKHVLCEKPIEIQLDRIDRMIEAHNRAGTWFGGIFNLRYNKTTQIIQDALARGRLGTITYASVHVPWWRTDAYYEGWHGTWELDGGGALMNQGIHMIDLLLHCVGPVLQLAAFAHHLGHPQIEAEDTGVAIMRFENQALGMVYGSTASFPGQFRRMEITGTKGTIVLVENSLQVWQFAVPEAADENIVRQHGAIEGGGGVADPSAMSYENHARNLSAFVSAIEAQRPFEIDGYEARKAVELVLKIYAAAGIGVAPQKAQP